MSRARTIGVPTLEPPVKWFPEASTLSARKRNWVEEGVFGAQAQQMSDLYRENKNCHGIPMIDLL
jgi:hypothetical protein